MRTPRPIGLTELCKQYNSTKDEIHYQSILQNIEQFSAMARIDLITIQKMMGEYHKGLAQVTKEMESGDLVRVLFQKAFSWGLEDKSLIAKQLNILLDSQQDSYKPFISGEVNRALKLNLDATTNMLQILRSLGIPNNAFVPISPEAQNAPENSVTIDQVVRLLKEEAVTPLAIDTNAKDKLYLEYDIENLPEVNALKQVGMDASKEGLSLHSITKFDGDIPEEEDKTTKHLNRRAKALGIDLEADEV